MIMNEYGIIHRTGEVFRVAAETSKKVMAKHDNMVSFGVTSTSTYIVDLGTGIEIKNRNAPCGIVDPTVRSIFMNTRLLSMAELVSRLDNIEIQVCIDKQILQHQQKIDELLNYRKSYDQPSKI